MSDETLEQRTLKYWRLSRKWNKRDPGTKRVRVQTALKQLSAITDITYYERSLKDRARLLADEIIRGGQSKKPSTEPSEVAKIERIIP